MAGVYGRFRRESPGTFERYRDAVTALRPDGGRFSALLERTDPVVVERLCWPAAEERLERGAVGDRGDPAPLRIDADHARAVVRELDRAAGRSARYRRPLPRLVADAGRAYSAGYRAGRALLEAEDPASLAAVDSTLRRVRDARNRRIAVVQFAALGTGLAVMIAGAAAWTGPAPVLAGAAVAGLGPVPVWRRWCRGQGTVDALRERRAELRVAAIRDALGDPAVVVREAGSGRGPYDGGGDRTS